MDIPKFPDEVLVIGSPVIGELGIAFRPSFLVPFRLVGKATVGN